MDEDTARPARDGSWTNSAIACADISGDNDECTSAAFPARSVDGGCGAASHCEAEVWGARSAFESGAVDVDPSAVFAIAANVAAASLTPNVASTDAVAEAAFRATFGFFAKWGY